MSAVSTPNVHGKVYIEFGDSQDGNYSYHQRFDSGRIWDHLVGRTTTPKPGADVFDDVTQIRPYEWYRLTIWHNASSNPNRVNIRWELLTTGTVLFEGTTEQIGPLSDQDGISWIQIWTEETTPYYYNFVVRTVPEPSTALLLALGSLALVRRRRDESR